MNIFLIRHGETDKSSPLHDWQYPITEKGHNQATIAGEFLREFFLANNLDINNTTILHSPYIRTTETCEHISNIFGLEKTKIFEIIEYQEGCNDEIPQQFLPTDDNTLLSQIYNNANSQPLDINESPYEIILRANQVLQQVKELEAENVIIITHNGFMRAFDVAFNNLSVTEYFRKQNIKNCSIRHYEIRENERINHGEILASTKDYQRQKQL